MNSLLNLWDVAAATIALVVIVVTAVGMMVGLVEVNHAFKRIGLALGCLIVVLTMPLVIVGIWQMLSFWQRVGLTAVFGLVAGFVLQRGNGSAKAHRPR